MKSLAKNVAIITFFTVITRLMGFLFRIFLSRAIGSEALGIYQAALSIFFVFLTIVSSGFTLIISRMTASFRAKNDKKSVSNLVTSCLLLGVVVSIVLTLLVLVCKGVLRHAFAEEECINVLIILLPSLVFSAVYCVFRGAMWGNDNYFGLCISEFVEQVVKIVVCILLLSATMSALQSASSVAWAFTISCVVSAGFAAAIYFAYGGKLGRATNVYKKVLRQAAPITGVRVLGSFTQPLVALILPARLIKVGYTATQAMSIYGVAIGMTAPLLFLPAMLIGSLTTALVPDVSMAMAKNDINHIQKRVQTSVNFALLVSFVVAPIFLAVGDKIGVFLFDNALSGTLLQFSAWMMIPMGLTNISSAILNSVGYEVKSFINFVLGDIFMFLALFFLPQFIGINALIVGMGVSYVIAGFLNFVMLKKKLKIKISIAPRLALLILLSLPTVALTSFTSSLLSFCMPLAINLILSCSLGFVVFVFLCMVFGVLDLSTIWVGVKKKFGKNKPKIAR